MSHLVPRPFGKADVGPLLDLMRGLAVFERYDQAFAVTEETLIEQGITRAPPDFHAMVVDNPGGGLAGMLTYHLIPFTLRARPTLFIKELFVAPACRSMGVGRVLMVAAAKAATTADCAVVKWQVARWNTEARRFYEGLGAECDEQWLDYRLSGEAIATLARGTP